MGSFGFGQQYAAPDYQTRAQAGLPVDPTMDDDAVSAQAAQALSAPAPQRQAQGLPDIPVSPFEALLSWAAHGGTPGEAAQNVRAVKLKNMMDQIGLQQAQQRFKLSQGLDPRAQLDYLTAPTEYVKSDSKNLEPQNVAAGNSVLFRGGPNAPGGSGFFAPKTDVSPSGVPYAITDTGYHPLGPQLPGKISVSPSGALVDENRGLTGESVSIPNNINPGQTPGSFVPSLIGGKFPAVPAPARGGASAASAPAASAPASAPRGIRNNNFGNVKALPNGQTWAGQTGVDGDAAVFANPADGVRAAKTNLESYGKEGVNTVAGIAQRWAGKNATPQTVANYTHFLAGAAHVDPGQPLDLSDPKIQAPILKGIFSFENGPQAMAAWRGPASQATASAQGGGNTSPGFHALGPAKVPQILSPEEAKGLGFAPGAVVERAPDGTTTIKEPGYGPEQVISLRTKLADSEPIKNYNIAKAAYGAMVGSAAQANGGMRAYALRDTFARLINPGAVARVGTIQAISEAQGLPANIKGYLMNLTGDGNVPPEIAQQILNISHSFLTSHYGAAKALNDNYGDFAARKGLDPADVQAPGVEAPARMQLGAIPPAPQRTPNTIYPTPKGAMKWTGTGWLKVN